MILTQKNAGGHILSYDLRRYLNQYEIDKLIFFLLLLLAFRSLFVRHFRKLGRTNRQRGCLTDQYLHRESSSELSDIEQVDSHCELLGGIVRQLFRKNVLPLYHCNSS